LTLARNAQKEFLIEITVGKKIFIKLSSVNKLAECKQTYRKQTSFNEERIYGRRQYMDTGSRSHATSPTISGWLLVFDVIASQYYITGIR